MKFFLIALLFAAAVVPIYLLIMPILTEKYCREMLKSSDPTSPELIPRLLRSFMPTSHVLTSLSLPIPGKDGEEISYGTVAVNRAGIFVISRICCDGLIENPPSEDKWKLMSRGAVTEFPNPFKEQDSPRRLLAYYASAAGVKNVKVHTLIVYTTDSIRFSFPPSKGTLHVSELHKRLRRADSFGKLRFSELHAITKLLRDVNAGIVELPEV
ncbi:MAG: hypothetical protein IJY04_01790 [Clostridia bacterium]|nr:hypothetical protein [Clostridia bacterium]